MGAGVIHFIVPLRVSACCTATDVCVLALFRVTDLDISL